MNRRQCLASITVGAAIFISGCLSDPGAEGGKVQVFEMDESPNGSATEASDDRIRDVAPIEEALQTARNGTGTASITVSGGEYDAVAQTLSELPWYEPESTDSSYPRLSGIYIRYENNPYAVVLTPFCADSWIIDTQSERGEYGWGGCIER